MPEIIVSLYHYLVTVVHPGYQTMRTEEGVSTLIRGNTISLQKYCKRYTNIATGMKPEVRLIIEHSPTHSVKCKFDITYLDCS